MSDFRLLINGKLVEGAGTLGVVGIGTELSQEGLEAFTQATIINMAK